MKRATLMVVAATLLAVLAWGCLYDPICTTCHHILPPAYLPQTSPENVVNNLMASYERREIDRYAALLDPTFIFKFRTADIPADLPRDWWNRDEDSTGTGALFNAYQVSMISVDLGAYASEDAGLADAPGARRIRLTHAKLEVEQVNGVTLLVQGDIQDMYFRKGSVAAGTDSTKWYLFEWCDLQGESGLKSANQASGHALDLAKSSPLIESMTWGKIKRRFE